MGSIPGPIITFRISQPELAGAVTPALQQIRSQAKSTSDAIADDWRRLAAQIRASVTAEGSSTKDLAASRQNLVTILDREISGLRTRNDLTVKELSNLKAQTLERERQIDAIKRGVSVGVTRGTSSALSQVSTQTTLGIERVADSIVDRIFGGAAGAAVRTLRDVSYYSAQASGTMGTGGGILSGFTGGLSTVLGSVSPAVLAGGAFTAGLAATGYILTSITGKMEKYAQAIQNQAAATGLSTVEVQRYNELAKITGVDSESLTTAFARMQVQLGEFVTKGEASSGRTQNLTRVLNSLGVSITTTGGALRPVNDVMSDFANVLAAIPDRETRTALALEAMGTRGRVLVQVMDEARASGETLSQALDKVGKAALPDSEIQQLLREKAAWDNIVVSIDKAKTHLEGFIATHRSAVLAGIINPAGALGEFVSGTIRDYTTSPGGPGSPKTPTVADAQALIAQAAEDTNKVFLERAGIIKAGGAEEYKLLQAEKNLSEALVIGNGDKAVQYANEVVALKNIIDLERQRAAINASIAQSVREQQVGTFHPSLGKRTPFAGGAAPYLGASSGPGLGTDLLAGILGPGDTVSGANLIESMTKQVEDAQLAAIKDGVDKANIEYQRDLQNFRLKLQNSEISQKQFNEAVLLDQQLTSAKIADVRQQELKKYEQDAGTLFDALVSGDKNLGKKLQSIVEGIVLAPIKEGFSKAVGKELQSIADSISGKSGGGTSWIAKLAKPITATFFPGGTIPGVTGAGQSSVSTATMNVRASVVNVAGGGTVPPGFTIGAGNGFLGTASSDLLGLSSGSSSDSLPFTPQGLSTAGIYTGGGVTGGSSGGLFSFLKNPAFAKAVGIGTSAAGFFGSLASAHSSGSAIGGLFSGAGSGAALGAEIGSVVPGLGTAIGAAVGAIAGGITGLLSGVFGDHFASNVQKAISNQHYIAPPSETFSFASNGSIANTLATGFSQSGNTFNQFGLPSGTPFYANAITGKLTWQQLALLNQQQRNINPGAPFLGLPGIDPFVGQGQVGAAKGTGALPDVHLHFELPGYVDSASATTALAPHIESITQMVTSKLHSSASGLGSAVRRAAYLP